MKADFASELKTGLSERSTQPSVATTDSIFVHFVRIKCQRFEMQNVLTVEQVQMDVMLLIAQVLMEE